MRTSSTCHLAISSIVTAAKTIPAIFYTFLNRCAFVIYLALSSLVLSPAQADEDKPRYVHEQGEDVGDCRNSFRPCATIDYALAVSGKGDSILVGKGEFEVVDADALFRILSASERLFGSRDKLKAYSVENREQQESVLIGLPPARRQQFEERGFRVLVDRKKIKDGKAKQHMLEKMQLNAASRARSDCLNNRADIYPCNNVNLLSQLSLADLKNGAFEASDIWGFQDLNTGREYIIIGLSNGVSVVDVSEAENPRVIGTHTGLTSGWRDIKILQTWNSAAERWDAFAYITTESRMGLSILDLRELPNRVSELNVNSDFSTAHNVYLSNIDYSFGNPLSNHQAQLVIAGSNIQSGNYRIYDLQNPASPTLLYAVALNSTDYMHDAASNAITNTQKSACPVGTSLTSCSVLTDFNEDQIRIWDISEPSQPELISDFSYPNAQYVHSGWWSEDGRYLFVHDELDEFYLGSNTRVRVFDLSDLANPESIANWTGPTMAIDHNGFVRGNRYYMSNYTAGLTILDISDPLNITRVGHLDTVTVTNSADFAGAWGVYPFLPSGTIAISDIESGLFLLEDETSSEAYLSFSSAHYSGTEGESLEVRVNRVGDEGALTTEIDVLPLNGSANDLSLSSTVLNWADGESGEQSIIVDLTSDSLDEDIEMLALRLARPEGNASYRAPHISFIHISDLAKTPNIQALQTTMTADESLDVIHIPIQRKQSSVGEISVDWVLDINGSSSQTGTLMWADGDSAGKTIALDNNFSGSDILVRLENPQGAELSTQTIALTFTTSGSSGSSSSSSSGGSAGNSSGGGVLSWFLSLCFLLNLAFRKKVN